MDKTEIVATMHTSNTETLFSKGWCPNLMGFNSQPLYVQPQKQKTLTAFRWTPAMSAIWPKDYRPTMTGLLAMWEAMNEAAEYGKDYYTRVGNAYSSQAASDDGWICNTIGKPPKGLNDSTLVDVKFRNGTTDTDKIHAYDWTLGFEFSTLTHWRIAK